MKPTNELRYLIRTIQNPIQQDAFLVAIDSQGKPVREQSRTIDVQVLQQKWVGREYMSEVEWRDVPFVKEDTI